MSYRDDPNLWVIRMRESDFQSLSLIAKYIPEIKTPHDVVETGSNFIAWAGMQLDMGRLIVATHADGANETLIECRAFNYRMDMPVAPYSPLNSGDLVNVGCLKLNEEISADIDMLMVDNGIPGRDYLVAEAVSVMRQAALAVKSNKIVAAKISSSAGYAFCDLPAFAVMSYQITPTRSVLDEAGKAIYRHMLAGSARGGPSA